MMEQQTMTGSVAKKVDGPAGGRDILHNLARATDRRLIFDLLFQLLLASLTGYLAGYLLEYSGMLVDGGGSPLNGVLALFLGVALPAVWGFVIGHLIPFWRERLQLFMIPLLRRTYLAYAVLEHRPHESAVLPLNLTPPALAPHDRRRTIRRFGVRIAALVWSLPWICRGLGYSDYPARWGAWLAGLFMAGLVFAGLCLVVTSLAVKAYFVLCSFTLLGGWLAFQQARLQATAWCLAALFLPVRDD